jgi:hypothetical protein
VSWQSTVTPLHTTFTGKTNHSVASRSVGQELLLLFRNKRSSAGGCALPSFRSQTSISKTHGMISGRPEQVSLVQCRIVGSHIWCIGRCSSCREWRPIVFRCVSKPSWVGRVISMSLGALLLRRSGVQKRWIELYGGHLYCIGRIIGSCKKGTRSSRQLLHIYILPRESCANMAA